MVLAAVFFPDPAFGQACPDVTVRVDNDIPGSGYSETRANNWASRPTGSCHGNYRYLSHTIGDGSRRGKAIFRPAIPHAGWYDIRSGYRATENRTSDADYVVYDDAGGVHRNTVDQRGAGGCEFADLGVRWCVPGGQCRVELDGTDDGASDSADLTTFQLVSCDDAPPAADPTPDPGPGPAPGPGPDPDLHPACAGIAANGAFEVCESRPGHCAGVFTNSAGCAAYCAAAGMVCAARFGGEPGCQKEADFDIGCGAANDHQSDWCECAPAAVDPPPEPQPEPGSQPEGEGWDPARPGKDLLARDGEVLTWCGEPVRLVGYGNYGIVAERAFDYRSFLDRMADEHGLNFLRVWGQYQWANDLMPFLGTRGDRDLVAEDPQFYSRLRDIAEYAAARGVVLQVTLFDSVQLEGSHSDGTRWVNSPYRSANNRQGYLDDPTDFNRGPRRQPPIWNAVNQPYIEAMVDTLCDLPNIVYEVMNEPEGSGGDAGRGTPAFVDRVIDELHRLLGRDHCSGSRLISTNDNPLRTLGNPKVDLVAVHVRADQTGAYAGTAKPILVSNDGDTSQVSSLNGFGSMAAADRPAHIARYASGAMGDGSPLGHMHLEVLDKDMHGASWKSQNYEPRADRVDAAVVSALAGFVATPPRTCGGDVPVRPRPDPPDDEVDQADDGAPGDGGSPSGAPPAEGSGLEDPGSSGAESDPLGGDEAETEPGAEGGAGHVGFCATKPGMDKLWWKRLIRR